MTYLQDITRAGAAHEARAWAWQEQCEERSDWIGERADALITRGADFDPSAVRISGSQFRTTHLRSMFSIRRRYRRSSCEPLNHPRPRPTKKPSPSTSRQAGTCPVAV
jgi:hypothetical protein